ncbi:MAG: His/Gly/Thr/Pro-type tRNA ligase C-terminal domain-containing protein, partial [Chlorobium sp.]
QEGHTAHETPEESQEEVLRMINVYKSFAEEYMAMPVIMGKKSDSEKFAGAVETYCIEAMMQDTKALQAGTSHNLGQNFAKAFDCQFQTKESTLEYVWATSWGVSTRLIGALIMAHSDDRGLVLPPKLATRQVVIIPILKGDKTAVIAKANAIADTLNNGGISAFVDSSEQNSPGWKFAEYELQGIPIRIEIGPRDIQNSICIAARRDTFEKTEVALDDLLAVHISEILNDIQQSMFDKALRFRNDNTYEVQNYEEFKSAVEKGFVIAHWDGTAESEAKIKEETKATIRVLPQEDDYIAQYRIDEPGTCIYSGKPAARKVVFAKAY